jgi:hypothetical protein
MYRWKSRWFDLKQFAQLSHGRPWPKDMIRGLPMDERIAYCNILGNEGLTAID